MSNKQKSNHYKRNRIIAVSLTALTIMFGIYLVIPTNSLDIDNDGIPNTFDYPQFIHEMELDENGTARIIYDKEMGELIWKARNMSESEQLNSIADAFVYQIEYGENTLLQQKQSLAIIYTSHPQNFIDLYSTDQFAELQLVEYTYRINELGHSTQEFWELAELQKQQFEDKK